MTTITLEKAQAELPTIFKRVLEGEDIVIAVDDKKIRLTPELNSIGFDAATASYRGYGALRGKFQVGPEFFEPLSDEECGVAGAEDGL